MKKEKKGWGETVDDLFKDLPRAPKITEMDEEYLTFEDGTKVRIGVPPEVSSDITGIKGAWDDVISSGGSVLRTESTTASFSPSASKAGMHIGGDDLIIDGESLTDRLYGKADKGYVDHYVGGVDARLTALEELVEERVRGLEEVLKREDEERDRTAEICTKIEVAGGVLRAMDAINNASPVECEVDETVGAKLRGLAPGALGRTACVRGAQMGAAWVIEKIREVIGMGEKAVEDILKDCEKTWAIEGKFKKKSGEEAAAPWRKYS